MTYPLAWYDYTKADSLTKENKLKDKLQIETLSIRILQTIRFHTTDICKLFSYDSKTIHALLASKRRLIDLQKVLFKTLTNALLKSNKAPFLILLYN